jgi:hypothetical protein
VVCAYSILFADRVKVALPHAYYLYYDRYLFSEVLPAALVFAAIALHMIVQAYTAAARGPVLVRVAIVGLCVVAAVGFLPEVRETHRITRFPLFGSAYEAIDHLDALTSVDGRNAVVYSAPKAIPPGWFFPNTYRAFALPLAQSFRRLVVGLPTDAFGRDPQFDPDAARAQLRMVNQGNGYLVSLRGPGQAARYPDDGKTHYIGSVSYVSPTLRRNATRSPSNWVLVPFVFDVYALS